MSSVSDEHLATCHFYISIRGDNYFL